MRAYRYIYISLALLLYQMLQNYSRYRVLQEFFDFPRKQFHLRELSRNCKLAQPSVLNHLHALLEEGLIVREEKGLYPTYRANKEDPTFKLLKQQNMVWRIYASKLLELIEETLRPNCIVLFGSASRGEDIEGSDIDLFIQAEEKELNFRPFEEKLKRSIAPFFEPEIASLSRELANNIINGHILSGYLKVL